MLFKIQIRDYQQKLVEVVNFMSVAAFWATCKIEVTYQVFSVHVHREFVQQVEVVGAEEFGWSKRSNNASVLEKKFKLLERFIEEPVLQMEAYDFLLLL